MAGRIIVGGNQPTGVTRDPARYAWLRENLLPIEKSLSRAGVVRGMAGVFRDTEQPLHHSKPFLPSP